MGNLNEGLMEDLVSNNCFITMVLVSYSPRSRRLTYANAGHIFPLVWSDFKQPQPRYLDVRGVPLGILPTWTAKAGEIDLVPGDTLLMASDGLTEATFKDAAGGSSMMLKQEGLWRMLQNQTPPFNLDELLTKIQTLNDFQEDDQTVLSLEVRR